MKKLNKRGIYSQRGSVMLVAIIFALGIGFLVKTYLEMATAELKSSDDAYIYNALLNMAEGGAEEATWALNNKDWTGWTDCTTHMAYEFTNIDLGGGKTGEVTIFAWDQANVPTLYVEARATMLDGATIKKQVEIELSYRSLFANGLTAKDLLEINGGAATIDSYDSAYGFPGSVNPTTTTGLNIKDKGTLGSTRVASDITGVDIGNSDVFGYVTTGGSLIDFGNGTVTGFDTPVGTDVDPDRVSYDFDIDLPDASPYTFTSTPLDETHSSITTIEGNNNTVNITGGTASAPLEYDLDELDFGNNSVMNINSGYVVFVSAGDVEIAELNICSTCGVTFYVAGDFDSAQGNNEINNSNPSAESLVIYGTQTAADAAANGPQEIDVGGTVELTAAIYAPNADLKIHGNAGFNGAAVAGNIELDGGVAFHYDEGLEDFFGGDPTFKVENWSELYRRQDMISEFADSSQWASFDAANY